MKLLSIAVFFLSLQAVAQQPPQPDQEAMLYDTNWLQTNAAESELMLTRWQTTRIVTARQRIFKESPKPTTPEETRAYMQAISGQAAVYTRDMIGMLAPWQKERLRQASLQRRGISIATNPVIASSLGLSNEQIEAINTIVRASMKEMMAMGPPRVIMVGAPGSASAKEVEEIRKKSSEMRGRMDDNIMKVLTPAQRGKWVAMLGKPIVFETHRTQ
jgi:hypothetical protein